MKNKDLVKQLQKLDPEMDVVVNSFHQESGDQLVDVEIVREVPTTLVTIQCRDMMDGEHYETTKRREVFLEKDKIDCNKIVIG